MCKQQSDKQLYSCYHGRELELIQIPFYRSDSQLMNDAIDRLVVKVHNHKQERNQKTVLLTGCGSANGTTTVSINLAIALSIAGWNTLLVDLDFRKGNAFKQTGRKKKMGLSEYISNAVDITEILFPTNHENLFFAPSGDLFASAIRLLCSERMATFIAEVKQRFDFIIFDCPSVTVVPDASVMFPVVDGIALVSAQNRTTRKQLGDAKLEIENMKGKYYGLIVNCVDERQYERFYPQNSYFDTKRLVKTHRKWLSKDDKRRN
ncbi:hypothetical protein FACS1894191_7280 [Clostridia bacterium]|nr:hypothetical protein FACS1894191_7280 [Clostridia bacterium]